MRRATGGLLTVLAESGSGTLAGSAHMEAFRQIAANDAISIAECINRQYVRRRIVAQFPGLPVLVYFTLTQPVINDRAATVNMLCQLAGQRWRATDEAVSEEVGVEVHTEEVQSENSAPPVPVMDGIVVNANSDLEDAADGELPLNEEELATLRFLGGGLNPAQVAADAAFMAEAMKEDLRLTNDDLRVEHSAAAPQEEEEVVANSCNQYEHDADCTGVGQHIPRHGKEGHTKPQRKEEQKRTEELPSDSVSKVLTDSDGHQYVRIPNHVKSWEDAEKILSAKIDLAVDKKGAHIKGIPGKGVRAPGMKKEVFITKPGMKSMLSGAHTRRSSDKKAHFSAAASADQLWRTSIFKSEEPDSRTNNPNLKIHRRTAEMRIGKQSYQVLLTAKIYSTKNDVSELHMVEIIK